MNDNFEDTEVSVQGIKQEILVPSQYKTIQEAINNSNPNTLIRVETGLYKESLVFKKPNIFLEPVLGGEVYLVGEDGPTILIDIAGNQNGQINIQNFKITSKGIPDAPEVLEENKLEIPKTMDEVCQLLSKNSKNKYQENLIFVKEGSLTIFKCEMTCNLLFKQSTLYNSCIYVSKSCQCIVTECRFRGSDNLMTSGVTSFEGNTFLKHCTFFNFKGAAVLFNLDPKNICNMYCCKFVKNNIGFMATRENNKSKITECEFEENVLGCLVAMCVELVIFKCRFVLNKLGILVIGADPLISESEISYNTGNGVTVRSDGVYTFPQFFDNDVTGNHKNGFKLKGEKNKALVKNNQIVLNHFAGVKVADKAYVYIHNNEISKNIFQGVCVKESAGAMIEKNNIEGNIKANIAIGGASSPECVILKNEILNGRCEGIFLAHTNRCRVYNNFIKNNHFGILVVNSAPVIISNSIKENLFHGILAIKKCDVNISVNNISRNRRIGVYVRDKCKGVIEQNIVIENEIDLLVEEYNEDLKNVVEQTSGNKFGDAVRIPFKKSYCHIF